LLASYIPIPVHPRSILLLAAAMVAIVAAVLLAGGAMGAGSPTRLHSFSFSSASGTMSSGSYGVIADLGSVGFVGRAASSNYTLQMGTGSTHTRARPGFLKHLPVVYSQTLSTWVGTPLNITLTGSDADGDTLGWAVVNPVNGGTIQYVLMSQTTNTIDVVFTPSAGFIGTGGFTFYATDGSGAGNIAIVTINVVAGTPPTPVPTSVPEATPTPVPNIGGTPTPTPIPITSGWGLAALAATLLVMTTILLRQTSGRRRGARL
jgi:hypothetical protein